MMLVNMDLCGGFSTADCMQQMRFRHVLRKLKEGSVCSEVRCVMVAVCYG